jgi:hypothetical protein
MSKVRSSELSIIDIHLKIDILLCLKKHIAGLGGGGYVDPGAFFYQKSILPPHTLLKTTFFVALVKQKLTNCRLTLSLSLSLSLVTVKYIYSETVVLDS